MIVVTHVVVSVQEEEMERDLTFRLVVPPSQARVRIGASLGAKRDCQNSFLGTLGAGACISRNSKITENCWAAEAETSTCHLTDQTNVLCIGKAYIWDTMLDYW